MAVEILILFQSVGIKSNIFKFAIKNGVVRIKIDVSYVKERRVEGRFELKPDL